jgi:rhamnogalacturonan acetylesterase
VRNATDYAGWAADVARSEGVAFIDLNEMIASRYDQMGTAAVDPLFGDEHTHTTRRGAELNAQCVIAGLKSLENHPLAPYFSNRAQHPH